MAGPPFRLALCGRRPFRSGSAATGPPEARPPAWCDRATRTTTNPDHMGRRRRRRRFSWSMRRCVVTDAVFRQEPTGSGVRPTGYDRLHRRRTLTHAPQRHPLPRRRPRTRAVRGARRSRPSAAHPRRHPAKQSHTGFGPSVITRVVQVCAGQVCVAQVRVDLGIDGGGWPAPAAGTGQPVELFEQLGAGLGPVRAARGSVSRPARCRAGRRRCCGWGGHARHDSSVRVRGVDPG